MTRKVNLLIPALILILTMLLSGCSGVQIEEEVTKTNLHQTAENVCRGFFQALYKDDEELFRDCFYEGSIDADGVDVMGEYRQLVDPDYRFVGTLHMATRPCDDDNGLNTDTVRENIAFFNGVSEDKIDEIVLVSVKTFFEIGEEKKENKSIEIYSIVYRSEGQWYFFSMVDRTAKEAK